MCVYFLFALEEEERARIQENHLLSIPFLLSLARLPRPLLDLEIYQQSMTVGTARTKIEAAEKLIAELQKQQGYLEIRLEQEVREIKALKHELEVMHIARDLPVPKVCAL